MLSTFIKLPFVNKVFNCLFLSGSLRRGLLIGQLHELVGAAGASVDV